MRRVRNFVAGMILAMVLAVPAAAQKPCGTITVAAASDLEFAMNEIVADYQKETGCMVRVTAGSSGNFFTQIENGAPFDVFFSADIDYPKKLEAESFAVAGTTVQYAVGKIVLWTRQDSHVDLNKGLAILRDPAIRKIAIANPEHAPYGRAAEQALKSAGVYDAVKGRLVLGENISQAAEFAESGNADVGIVALSLALSAPLKDKGRYSQIPENLYAPLQQGATIIRASKNIDSARAFLAYIKKPAIAALLTRYGFAMPTAGKEKPTP
jgi:molybdate transport system substrate-binding protein